MKRILFVDHVTNILGGAEINLVELLEASGEKWSVACACCEGSRLATEIDRIQVRRFDYGFSSSLNELRIVGKRFSPWRALQGFKALKWGRERLEKVIQEFAPAAVVSCTNKDHLSAAPLWR